MTTMNTKSETAEEQWTDLDKRPRRDRRPQKTQKTQKRQNDQTCMADLDDGPG